MSKIEGIFKTVLYVLFIILVCCAAYRILLDQSGAFPMMVLAVLVIVGARLPDIVKLKFGGSGIEAEMQRIRETLDELHVVSELFAKISLTQMQSAGRWGGYRVSERVRMRTMIVDGLKSIGVSKDRIDRALAVEYPFMQFDYARAAISAAETQREKPATDAIYQAFFDGRPEGIGNEPTVTEMQSLFSTLGITEGEAYDALLDYRHFVETRTHRRSAV